MTPARAPPSLAISPALLAGAVAAAVAAVLVAGLAYIFQPAWEAHRARQATAEGGGRRYAFPVFNGSGGNGGGKKKTKQGAEEEGEGEGEAPFPTLEDAPSLLLSLVVPAYNEEARLPVMLDETLAYLEQWRGRNKCVRVVAWCMHGWMDGWVVRVLHCVVCVHAPPAQEALSNIYLPPETPQPHIHHRTQGADSPPLRIPTNPTRLSLLPTYPPFSTPHPTQSKHRTHARTHARARTRTHARTHARTQGAELRGGGGGRREHGRDLRGRAALQPAVGLRPRAPPAARAEPGQGRGAAGGESLCLVGVWGFVCYMYVHV